MIKTVVEPKEKVANGMDKVIYDHYMNRTSGSVKMPDVIGPVVCGVDVGKRRYSDFHPSYELVDLAADCDLVVRDFNFFDSYTARYYCPKGVTDPTITTFYVHGGGWTAGRLSRLDNINRRLAQLINGPVVYVEYTLSPEAAYPVAVEQIYHCINYFVDHAEEFKIDPEKVTILGDSAGGNLCNTLVYMDKEKKLIKYLFLYYAAVDLSNDSLERMTWDYYGGEDIDEFLKNKIRALARPRSNNDPYLQNKIDCKDPAVSVCFDEDLSYFPPTTIYTAEFDFLRRQNEELAEKLDACGVEVEYTMFAGTFHGFLERVGVFDQSDISMKMVADRLHEYFK